jgi:ParB-like chromosome segregation protein Spo0J
LAELKLDPRNARKHDARNLAAIAASLKRFGQVKPIVANRATRQIAAGNGTYLAAQQLGWTHLAVVWVEQDAASHLGYSLADNRTAELASWDEEMLQALLLEVEADSPDLYAELLLGELRQEADEAETSEQEAAEEPDASPQLGQMEYRIVILCEGEQQQCELLERFEQEGLQCRALVS